MQNCASACRRGCRTMVSLRMRSKNAFDGGLKRVPKRLLFGPQTNPGFHAGEVVVKVVHLLIVLRDCGGQRKGRKGNRGGKRPKGNSFHGDTLVGCLVPAFAEAGLV